MNDMITTISWNYKKIDAIKNKNEDISFEETLPNVIYVQ